jgi:hypothetical protein
VTASAMLRAADGDELSGRGAIAAPRPAPKHIPRSRAMP